MTFDEDRSQVRTGAAPQIMATLRNLDLEVNDVVGLGAGADTAMLERKRDVVTGALARARRITATCVAGPARY